MRRHDTLPRLALSLTAALLCGLLLEANGLHTWAERLAIGPLRAAVLPLSDTWLQWSGPFQLGQLRRVALQAKDELAPMMLAAPEPMTAPTPPRVLVAVAAPAAPAPVPTRASIPLPPVPLVTQIATTPSLAEAPAPSGAMLASDASFDIALAGDSMMAVGLAPTLKRWLTPHKQIHVLTAYRSGTGLARPEVFDWVSAYPQMLGAARPAIVICAMGGNDAQSVQVGKKVLQFDTPEWDAFFRARLHAYLDVVARAPAHVLWLGMPEMRSAPFSERMAHLNSLVKSTLADYPNATWLDMRAVLDPRGQGFQQFRTGQDGKVVKLREDDGIHLTDDGAVDLLAPIQNWVATNQQRGVGAPVSGIKSTGARL